MPRNSRLYPRSGAKTTPAHLSRFIPRIEDLESRELPVVSASFITGLLTIAGDSGANVVQVTYTAVSSQNYILVNSGGSVLFDGSPTGQNVLASDVDGISVDMAGGNDSVDLLAVWEGAGFSTSLEGAITINGGDGDDTIIGSVFGDRIDGGNDNDSIDGAWGFDTLSGGAGADLILGNSVDHWEADEITGGGGNDTLRGGSGDDIYFYSGTDGSDYIDESSDADSDLLEFGSFGAGVTLDLSSTSAQSIGGSTTITLSSTTAIENVLGSIYGDDLIGNDRDNLFIPLQGNDTLDGGMGLDVYAYLDVGGGQGTDTIVDTSDGNLNVLFFNEYGSAITVDLSSSSTQSIGGGTSLILTNPGAVNAVLGTIYNDSITGTNGDDSIAGIAGDDTLVGGSGNDGYVYSGGDGSDSIVESSSVDYDTLIFVDYSSGVSVDLSAASTQSIGGGTTLLLSNSTAIENIIGSAYADNLTGNASGNMISSGDGADSVSGGDGSDNLFGGDGNDTLLGGNADDTLIGGAGNDSMTGGGGSDAYYLEVSSSGSDLITEAANVDFDEVDFSLSMYSVSIDLALTSSQSWGGGSITFSSSTSIEKAYGSDQSDQIYGNSRPNYISGNGGDDEISGHDGNDYLLGYNGNDTLTAGDGNDTIVGGMDSDSLVGEDGDDTYQFDGASGADTVDEVSGIDADSLDFSYSDTGVAIDIAITSPQSWGGGSITLSSATSIEVVIGSIGADTVSGNSENNILFGGDGDDTLFGLGGDDFILGGEGSDSLVGGGDDDAVLGGEGDDVIEGDSGIDLLAGGVGVDTVDGGNDDDVLISGDVTTSLPSSLYLLAIDAVLSTWTGAGSYSDRVDNVVGDPGAPDPLPTGIRLVVGETLVDDGDSDSLTGGGSDDLFFYDNGEDVVSDLSLAEIALDIG